MIPVDEVRPDVAHQLLGSRFLLTPMMIGMIIQAVMMMMMAMIMFKAESLAALLLHGMLFWKHDCGWNNNFSFVGFVVSFFIRFRLLSVSSTELLVICFEMLRFSDCTHTHTLTVCSTKFNLSWQDTHTSHGDNGEQQRQQPATAWHILEN